VRVVLVVAGIIVPQFLLYGPSLMGRKVLLPLEILARPGTYLPGEIAQRVSAPPNNVLSDLVFAMEPFRVYAVREVRAGRLPLWNPNSFCGSPVSGETTRARCSRLYRVLDYLFPSPVTAGMDESGAGAGGGDRGVSVFQAKLAGEILCGVDRRVVLIR
jgi:hypothetical protein